MLVPRNGDHSLHLLAACSALVLLLDLHQNILIIKLQMGHSYSCEHCPPGPASASYKATCSAGQRRLCGHPLRRLGESWARTDYNWALNCLHSLPPPYQSYCLLFSQLTNVRHLQWARPVLGLGSQERNELWSLPLQACHPPRVRWRGGG